MGEHYFSIDPDAPIRTTAVTVRAWGQEFSLTTGSGVFSHGRLDTGTAVLLRTIGAPTQAHTILDLGCGYGVIGLAAALAVPTAQVVGVDVNQRALALARTNAANLGVADRYRALEPGEVPAEQTFDVIISNPPIRIGKAALHELLLTWLPRLNADGKAQLVVGKNLGADSLQRWLTANGFPTRRLGSAKGFRVLEAIRE